MTRSPTRPRRTLPSPTNSRSVNRSHYSYSRRRSSLHSVVPSHGTLSTPSREQQRRLCTNSKTRRSYPLRRSNRIYQRSYADESRKTSNYRKSIVKPRRREYRSTDRYARHPVEPTGDERTTESTPTHQRATLSRSSPRAARRSSTGVNARSVRATQEHCAFCFGVLVEHFAARPQHHVLMISPLQTRVILSNPDAEVALFVSWKKARGGVLTFTLHA